MVQTYTKKHDQFSLKEMDKLILPIVIYFTQKFDAYSLKFGTRTEIGELIKQILTIVFSDCLPLSGHLVNNLSWHFLCTAVWQAKTQDRILIEMQRGTDRKTAVRDLIFTLALVSLLPKAPMT